MNRKLSVSAESRVLDVVRYKWLNRLRVANFVVLLWVVITGVVVDGNGRLFGLAQKTSCIVTVSSFSSGILLSILLAVLGRGHRIEAMACLIIYAVLAAPVVLP